MATTAERLKQIRDKNRGKTDQIVRRYYEKASAQMSGKPVKVSRDNDFFVARADGTLEKVAEACAG